MCTIGKRIKERRKSLGLSAEDLAAMVGMSPATIYRYEKGDIKKVDTTKLTPIAQALETTEADLMGWTETAKVDASAPANLPSNVMPIVSGTGQRVRVLGEIAAGKPLYMEEDYETWVDAPMKADFALVVKGDSMYPTYLDGDVVYIKAQPDVDDGQVAAVAVDDSATLKHVYHLTSGINLISDNPAHPPIFVDPADQEIRILGIVVGFTRMYANANKLSGVSKGMPKK